MRDSFLGAYNALPFVPEVTVSDEPTYSEFLEAAPSPIGGGEILWTGTDPIHPGDCNNYPNSPLCGGSAVDPGGIGAYGPTPLSGGLSISTNPTETVITVDLSTFGIPLPSRRIGFRTPGAREAVEEYWRRDNPTIVDGFQQTFGNPGCTITWITFNDFYSNDSQLARFTPGAHITEGHENVVFSHIPPEHYSGTSQTFVRRWAYLSFGVEGGFASWTRWQAGNPGRHPRTSQGFTGFRWAEGQIIVTHFKLTVEPWAGFNYNPDFPPWGEWKWTETYVPPNGSIATGGPYEARQGVHPARFSAIPWNPPPPPPGPPPLPPISPALQPEDPMACDCKKIEKCLAEIKKALGTKLLPWNLPENLGTGEGTVEIDNYAELQLWHFNQLSTMLGQTNIKIKIKDTDLTQGGDQEVELEFANLSEAVAELAGLAITNQSLSSANLNASLTGLIQSGMAFTTTAVVDKHIEEIMEFLGFGMKRDTFKVPLAYTPGETAPDEILKDSEANLSYWKNTDNNTLQNYMTTMEQAAAIIRAALWERIGTGLVGINDVKSKVEEVADSVGSDLDTFLDRVEQGYLDAAGSQDVTPYGRDFSERPRIRKIGGRNEDDGSNT